MEYDALYKTLPPMATRRTPSNPAIVAAMKIQMKEFVCPSNPRGTAQRAQPPAGITNYKAMGASTRDSLRMVVDPTAQSALWHHVAGPGHRTSPSRRRDLSGQRHPACRHPGRPIAYASSRWKRSTRLPAAGSLAKKQRSWACRKRVRPRARRRKPRHFFAPPGYDGNWGAGLRRCQGRAADIPRL